MSLAPGEQRALSAIENQLKGDPRLAAMFAIFTGLVSPRQGLVCELMSPWQSRRRRSVVLAVLLVLLAVLLVLLAGLASAAGRVHHHGPRGRGASDGSDVL